MKFNPKIKTKEEIEIIVENLRKKNPNLKIVTTNGSFDILHSAHINLLEKAKEQGDILFVLINSDSSIRRFKGNTRPIIPQDERARMLEAIQYTDYIIIFDEDKPLNILAIIKPNIHVKGGSFLEERLKEEKDLLSSWQGKLMCFNLEEGHSTTNIIKKVRDLPAEK